MLKSKPSKILVLFIISLISKDIVNSQLITKCPTGCTCERAERYFGDEHNTLLKFWCDKNNNIPEADNDIIEGIEINGNVTSIPSNLANESCYYQNIRTLKIEFTSITNLQEKFFSCTENLRFFFLFHNKIKNITSVFDRMVNLGSVQFQNNEIERIENTTFCKLKRLRQLNLSKNKITEISSDTCIPESIITLHLESNQLTSK